MDNRRVILGCLHEGWPDDVSMLGDDVVNRIVDDALCGNTTPIRTVPGGYNFDLSPYINEIINATALLISLADFLVTIWTSMRQSSPPARSYSRGADPLDQHQQEEDTDLIEMLTEFVIKEKNLERRKAAKLARLVLRIASDGCQL